MDVSDRAEAIPHILTRWGVCGSPSNGGGVVLVCVIPGEWGAEAPHNQSVSGGSTLPPYCRGLRKPIPSKSTLAALHAAGNQAVGSGERQREAGDTPHHASYPPYDGNHMGGNVTRNRHDHAVGDMLPRFLWVPEVGGTDSSKR